MMKAGIFVGLLLISTAVCADNENENWIASLQHTTQDSKFMQTLGQDETLTQLMNIDAPSDTIFGHTSAQSLVDMANENQSGKATQEYLNKLSDGGLESELQKSYKVSSTDNANKSANQTIGEMLQQQFLNGPKISISSKDPLLLHAAQLQKNTDNSQQNDAILLSNSKYEEYDCEENVHQYTEIIKESLKIDFQDPIERIQPISLYAAANNDYSVTITADLLTGKISSQGNGQNALHVDSKVVSPIGTLSNGSHVEFKRTIPYGFWNGITELVQVSVGPEPSQSNGYQYSFGLSQQNCNKKNKALCNQYRGMQHHWEAHIFTSPVIAGEHWVGAEKLHSRILGGLCKKVASRCLGKPETKIFDNGGLNLTRDCWEQETTYKCVLSGQQNSSCESYQSQGCEQVNSTCIQAQNGICSLYQQRYRCPTSRETSTIDVAFDLKELAEEGHPLSFEENNDFGEALGALSVVNAFAKEQVTKDGNQGNFFGGEPSQCEALPTQCCAKKGVIKKIFGCSEEEETLAPKVQNGLCHLVGETKEGLIHKKVRHYCCFHSKLARIAQVGARIQLGIGFGEIEAPNCRALSVEELQRIDWGRVDFNEIAQDFAQKAHTQKINNSVKQQFAKNVDSNQIKDISTLSNNINQKINNLNIADSDLLNNYYQNQSEHNDK